VSTAYDAAVCGGGIAGIAAAVRLADAGKSVVLIEQAGRLGGRAGSFDDPALGEPIDNCQHVVLGCCSAYLALLERLGVSDAIDWSSGFHFIEPDGRRSTLPILPLPAPLHGVLFLPRARFLAIRDRLSVASGLAAMLRFDAKRWRGRSFSAWLEAHAQPAAAVERFWAPIVISACNARPESCDAAVAAMVFRDGFLASSRAPRMGVPRVPLRDLYNAVPGILARAGGEVRLTARVERAGTHAVHLRSGEPIRADRVILALPHLAAADLIERSGLDPGGVAASLRRLRVSPIVGAHLHFDSPVSDLPHAVMLDAQIDWLFFKDGGRRVHAVASAADALVDAAPEAIIDRVTGLLRERMGLGETRPTWARVVKERRATFLPEPGAEAHRPATAALGEVLLAGDSVATGWPATMEGAARSGNLAAEALLSRG
jgi:zeta-carotene desaturase